MHGHEKSVRTLSACASSHQRHASGRFNNSLRRVIGFSPAVFDGGIFCRDRATLTGAERNDRYGYARLLRSGWFACWVGAGVRGEGWGGGSGEPGPSVYCSLESPAGFFSTRTISEGILSYGSLILALQA